MATRPGAKLYFGFKDKITKEELAALEERSETEKDIMGTEEGGAYRMSAKQTNMNGQKF